jgi:DNA-binding NarL/FixJ family response regulator
MRVRTAGDERRWCNFSTMIAPVEELKAPCAIHIVRDIDVRKRMEMVLYDFVVRETGLPAENVANVVAAPRSATRQVNLSAREADVLLLLGRGATTGAIGAALRISASTANNHVQHILKKLGAHTRLEAIRRAETAGLLRVARDKPTPE